MLFLLAFGSIFYCCGKRRYNNAEKHEAHAKMLEFLKERKEVIAK